MSKTNKFRILIIKDNEHILYDRFCETLNLNEKRDVEPIYNFGRSIDGPTELQPVFNSEKTEIILSDFIEKPKNVFNVKEILDKNQQNTNESISKIEWIKNDFKKND